MDLSTQMINRAACINKLNNYAYTIVPRLIGRLSKGFKVKTSGTGLYSKDESALIDIKNGKQIHSAILTVSHGSIYLTIKDYYHVGEYSVQYIEQFIKLWDIDKGTPDPHLTLIDEPVTGSQLLAQCNNLEVLKKQRAAIDEQISKLRHATGER